MFRSRRALAAFLLSLIAPFATAKTSLQASSAGPSQDYLVYVVCESADKVVLLRFGPHGFHEEHETHIGLLPVDINGPHGIAVSPDKQFVYVSVGHGRPDGSAWKLKAGTEEVVQYTPLGLFPATADISQDGEFLYVANANFHGDMVPSSISVVATGALLEVKRITTCTMPHGSRLSPDGTKHYSACMMDDMLAEIDTQKFAVSRYFMLSVGKEMGMPGAPQSQMKMGDLTCVPTWAQPSNDGSEIYVACNKANDIVVVDTILENDQAIPRRQRRLQPGDDQGWPPGRHQQARPVGFRLRSEVRKRTCAPAHQAQGGPRRSGHAG